MISELLICGAALGAGWEEVVLSGTVSGAHGVGPRWTAVMAVPAGWGECGYLLPFSITMTGAPPRSCTERAWPVGVDEFSVQRTRKIKSGNTLIWSEFSRHIRLVCPSLHVTYRKVKGEKKP